MTMLTDFVNRLLTWILAHRLLAVGSAVVCLAGSMALYGTYHLGRAVGDQSLRAYLSQTMAHSKTARSGWQPVQTHLHRLEVKRIALPRSVRTGGAIAEVGGVMLAATPEARLGYLNAQDRWVDLSAAIPMNEPALRRDPVLSAPSFRMEWFRVHDMISVPRVEGLYDLYISHHLYADGCITNAVSTVPVRVAGHEIVALDGAMHTIYAAQPCIAFHPDRAQIFAGHQAGGALLGLADGSLLLSMGDHKLDGRLGTTAFHDRLMDPDYPYGKILRLDPATGVATVYAQGLRNVQGLAQDRDGRLWASDHGPMGGDELNVIEPGDHYGWPAVTLGVQYGAKPWPYNPQPGRHEGFAAPRFAWLPSIGATALAQITGSAFPDWDGDLLVGALRGEDVFRLRLNGLSVIYAEPLGLGERVRDIVIRENGTFAVYADKANQILLIRRAEDVEAPAPDIKTQIARIAAIDHPGRAIFTAHCASCHALTAEHGLGPHLVGLSVRAAGSAEGFVYSAALGQADRPWSKARLRRFIAKPQTVYAGSTMAGVGLTQDEMSDLLAFLEML